MSPGSTASAAWLDASVGRCSSSCTSRSSGGAVLLAAALIALIWANSPWQEAYRTLFHTEISLQVGSWSLSEDLTHWINDGLMAIFFYVVGVEIKREWVSGELQDRRAAALPAFAALGGMVVPAAIYLAITAGTDASHGWGIPMATDIAFALSVLALIGRRLPSALPRVPADAGDRRRHRRDRRDRRLLQRRHRRLVVARRGGRGRSSCCWAAARTSCTTRSTSCSA